MIFHYELFGLRIDTCIEMPTLYEGSGPADVIVEYGSVPEFIADVQQFGVLFQVKPDAFLFTREGTARYQVSEGKRITIDRFDGAEDMDIRQFLLGAGMGAMLHQRRRYPLHGSVVTHAGEGYVFIGASGHGKSTIAAAMHKRGHIVFGDDVCVFSHDDPKAEPLLYPGPAQIQIWPNTAEAIGEDMHTLAPLRRRLNKRALINKGTQAPEPARLKRIFLLSPDNGAHVRLDAMQAPETIQALVNNTYRVEYLQGMGALAGHFRQCAALAARVPMHRLIRPMGSFELDALADLIEHEMGAG